MVKTEAAFFVVTPGRNLAHGIAFSCGFRYDKTSMKAIRWTADGEAVFDDGAVFIKEENS